MDAWVYEDAHSRDLDIPDGKYYLADAGFPASQQLLVPYHAGVRYVSSHFLNNSLMWWL